jgi:urease accessory protein
MADTFRSFPGLQAPHGLALFGPFAAFGVVTVFARQASLSSLCATLRAALAEDETEGGSVLTGVSELPNDAGVSVRMLGASGSVVDRARTTTWNAARQHLLGVPAFDVRKP